MQTQYTILNGSDVELNKGTAEDVLSFISEHLEYDRRDSGADQLTNIKPATIKALKKAGFDIIIEMESLIEDNFKSQYITRLREVSPQQPERWYMWQANQAWINKLKRDGNSK